MVGGLLCVVIRVKRDPNRLRSYGAVGGRKWPIPITFASGLYNSLYYRTSRDYSRLEVALNAIQSKLHSYNIFTLVRVQ